jgi:Cdc6-like AAA superfamily ATPase
MAYVIPRKSRLQNQLTNVQAQIDNLNIILTDMALTGAQSYMFDSGEGSQRTTRRSLKEMEETLERLYARESHLINELNRMGVVSIRLRRKTPSGRY